MHKYMPHTDYLFPWGVRMIFLKLIRKHIGCFADDFHIFDDSEVQHLVSQKVLSTFPIHEIVYIPNGLKDVQQSTLVTRFFSHISIFYLSPLHL